MLSRLGEVAERKGPLDALGDLLAEVDYEGWLVSQAKDPMAADRAAENVQELVRWLERMLKQNRDWTLHDLLAQISLLDRLADENENDADGVRLMTLHAAKGLEFSSVFLVGVEEDQLPHKNSLEGADLEEERRLLYVGITRARQRLTISYCQQRQRHGSHIQCTPSRFLEELPGEDLRWEGRDAQLTDDQRRERGREAIANLRDLLAEG